MTGFAANPMPPHHSPLFLPTANNLPSGTCTRQPRCAIRGTAAPLVTAGGETGKMAILFRSSPAATARWRPLLTELMPEHEFRFWPEIGDPAEIEYAMVWQPPPGMLASLANL